MLVHSYADKLLEYYDSVNVDVKPARLTSDGKRATVDTTLNRKDGKPPIAVSFSMRDDNGERSEEHTSELQSLMRISYAVFCLKKKKSKQHNIHKHITYTQQNEIVQTHT